MKTYMLILAILGIHGGVVGTLTMITAALAAGANSSPESMGRIKVFLFSVVALGLVVLGGGVALTNYCRPGLAAIVGIIPLDVVVGWMFVLGIQQSLR